MKILKGIAIAGLTAGSLVAQVVPKPAADPSTGRAAWLDEAKYGMFIHWGLYSSLGGMWCGKGGTFMRSRSSTSSSWRYSNCEVTLER